MEETMSKKNVGNIYFLTVCAMMAAIMCIVSPLSIPIGDVPVSLATLIVYIAVWLIGMEGATISVIVYLLLGLVGLPVFSGGQGGPGKLTGPTGGYLVGYILLALISGLALKVFKRKLVPAVIGMIVATAVLYAFGTAWFIYQSGATFGKAMKVCVLPFIPFDLVKIAVSAIIGMPAVAALKKAGLINEK